MSIETWWEELGRDSDRKEVENPQKGGLVRRALRVLLDYCLITVVYYALLLQSTVSEHVIAWLKESGVMQN